MKRFLLVVWGGVDVSMRGPYKSEASRLRSARWHCRKQPQDGFFAMDVPASRRRRPVLYPFSEEQLKGGRES